MWTIWRSQDSNDYPVLLDSVVKIAVLTDFRSVPPLGARFGKVLSYTAIIFEYIY